MQTLVFAQKPELELAHDEALRLNRAEVEIYKASLTRIRHIIVDEQEQDDASIVLRVKKQYNDSADVDEYFY